MDTKLDHQTELLQEIRDKLRNKTTKNESLFLRGLSYLLKLFKSKQQPDQPAQPAQPKLGQFLFTLHHQIDLSSVVGGYQRAVTDIVMMDDGRLVICLPYKSRLLICNTDGSQVDSIYVQGGPEYVTAINKSTVAVTLWGSECIEMFDINNKLKLKSISLPGMWCGSITTINNKLVVFGDKSLLIIDHQTGEVVQTIQKYYQHIRSHGSGDRIFYIGHLIFNNHKLYWDNYTDDRHHNLKLSSPPRSMTTLQDGCLYVVCKDGSVQHVSSDGKQYKPVTTGLEKNISMLHYNPKQKNLCQ